MSYIKDMDIFILNRFVGNINCKLSTVTDYSAKHQILCVVSESNELLLHFTNIKRCDILKVVTWFKQSSKNVIDVCFDPTGLWLLVLCFDNTIHIIPTPKILGKQFWDVTNNTFSTNFITSFEIPLFGSSQCDPNPNLENQSENTEYTKQDNDEKSSSPTKRNSLETELNKDTISVNELSKSTAWPTSITWWNTRDNLNRAIIGYSDGTLCYFGLDSNSPFTATSSTGNATIDKLLIYKDNRDTNILLITLRNKEQYKVILEQGYSDYTFSSAIQKTPSQSTEDCKATNNTISLTDENIIETSNSDINSTENITKNSLRSSTKSRLASLKLLGSKKNNLKMKIAEPKDHEYEDAIPAKNLNSINLPLTPELINNKTVFNYVTQHIRNISFLSVLDSDSNTLSVHHMDENLLTLFRYKVPDESSEILITSNILYSIQNSKNSENNPRTTITLLSSALASIKDNIDKFDFQHAVLSSFNFYNENLINIHRKASFFTIENEKTESCDFKETPMKNTDEYYFYNNNTEKNTEYLSNEGFQKIIFDPCYVVTNKNIYYIDMRKDPLELIIDAASVGLWTQCEQFCNTFNIPLSRCLEFVGDHFLRKKKVNQALLSYNVVKIPPVRTALKLAMNRENYPLMHLCAMALKHVYITKSKYFNSPVLRTLLKNIQNLHVEDVLKILPKRNQIEMVNDGQHCSDHKYCPDDSVTSLQMTLSSQFHLSNLMLITLAEKAVRDKNYIPLWNFLMCNGKYHTHMTSIVLTQSGLHSSALVLAMTRGCFIEVFVALTSVLNQEFGVYSEINVCLYSLSDPIFLECLLYLQNVTEQYFNTVQKKLQLITMPVLKRLEKQFSPFASIFRSMFDKYYLETSEEIMSSEKSYNFISFFSTLIETYLAIIIHMHHINNSEQSNILNAFSTFTLEYEDVQKFENTSKNFIPLSVGYTHCTCVIDGVVYFWGSNGVPTVFSIENIQDTNEPFHTVKKLDLLQELNLEVYAVKCGRQHTMILTNNGIFTFGSNQLYQLGIGKNMLAAQHPMLVQHFDCKNITLFDAGQYHNAVVANNKLYTWGWGLYGQLGHGNTENVEVPTVVAFFNDKKIINISLGHAHSLVLCINGTCTELYVFGSNHFGQLGIGILSPEKQFSNKILTPLLLNIGKNIIQIQTKFFSNLAVTDNNQLYTWGSSPQALRLDNQNKKRANSKQKIAATLTKEIRRRTALDQSNSVDSHNENKPANSNEQQNNIEDCDSFNCTNNIDESNIREKKKISPSSGQQSQFTTPPSNTEITSEHQNIEIPNMDHMSPRLIDTEKISGSISHLATGLFHSAVICSDNFLYTWGRNFDHQLGNQDKERKYISEPAKVDCIDYALYVDCGADFTVVMTKENVKAFGGNANGQCGLDVKQSVYNNLNQNRLLCLPITKRFMRFETHSVVCPHNIDLPIPKSNLIYNTIKYIKPLPKYSPRIVTKIHEKLCEEKCNLFSLNTAQLKAISNKTSDKKLPSSDKKVTAGTCRSSFKYSSDYIHYCLFLFHKLYNPEKVMNFAKDNLEYQIRILLLNLDFVQAFRACLQNCHTAQSATKIFQYFTKNSDIVPIKIENFKIYIYGLLSHFVARNFDMNDCESFFLSDLDYYLSEISFVLYLNSESSKLTNILRRKFAVFFKIHNNEDSFDAIDLIFEKLSIKFKTIICQNILKSLKV